MKELVEIVHIKEESFIPNLSNKFRKEDVQVYPVSPNITITNE